MGWWDGLRRIRQRWQDGLAGPIETQADLRRARAFALWADVGVLRLCWTNFGIVADGVYRANHGSAARVGEWSRLGIRTIVNLRGERNFPTSMLSQRAAESLGMQVISLPMSARRPPRTDTILALLDLFDRIERPFLMHCKSGADRSGLAAAIWLLHVERRPLSEARRQLSLRYLHIKFSQTGVLDEFLDLYRPYAQDMPFRQWVSAIYDPAQLQR